MALLDALPIEKLLLAARDAKDETFLRMCWLWQVGHNRPSQELLRTSSSKNSPHSWHSNSYNGMRKPPR